jgi:hypothetical protein
MENLRVDGEDVGVQKPVERAHVGVRGSCEQVLVVRPVLHTRNLLHTH